MRRQLLVCNFGRKLRGLISQKDNVSLVSVPESSKREDILLFRRTAGVALQPPG